MDAITLHSGPLTFSSLSAGFEENPDGSLVILLHGFPDNPRSYRHQLPALAAAGFRVVAPTMRGYEPSSIPEDHDFRVTTLARDIPVWLDELGVERAHLVGHDWGALVAYPAAALFPDRLLSLTTIAIPPPPRFLHGVRRVPKQLLNSQYVNFFQLRGIAERALERDDWAYIRKLWRNWSPSYSLSAEDWEDLRTMFSAPGVKDATLQYYRQNASMPILLGLKRSEALQLRTIPVRTLAITGVEDGCIDTRMHDHTFFDEDFPNGHRIERVEGAGHFVQLEKPESVNQMLMNWFDSD